MEKLQNTTQFQGEQHWFLMYNVLVKAYGLEVAGLYGYLLDQRKLSYDETMNKNNNNNIIDEDGIYSCTSYDELKEELNMTEYKIKKCKKILRDIGLTKEKRQMDGSNKIYTYDIPAEWKYKYGRKSTIL